MDYTPENIGVLFVIPIFFTFFFPNGGFMFLD